jgi:hypothetical protein
MNGEWAGRPVGLTLREGTGGEVGAGVRARARGLVVSSRVRAVKAGNGMAGVRYGRRCL